MNVSQNESIESVADSISGLVDSRGAARALGISVNTFKVWASRSKTAKSGIPSKMPKPVGTLNGSVYRLSDIENFGREIALHSRSPRSSEKANGRYFTPSAAAEFMARWAMRASGDRILEPSAGDGQFLLAVKKVSEARGWSAPDLYACELDENVAAKAASTNAVESDKVFIGDFLALEGLPKFDVVIGNPPYVRVRELDSRLKASALAAYGNSVGRKLDPAASVWVPFVTQATKHLRDGGRLAFVLPYDFTYVRYARPLWDFLGSSFGRLTVVRCRERIFRDIGQDVVILLAEEKGASTSVVGFEALDNSIELEALSVSMDEGARSPARRELVLENIVGGAREFTCALLPDETTDALSLLESYSTVALERVKFNIGYVSGNKGFFNPTAEVISRFGLPESSLWPTVRTSRELAGCGLRTNDSEAVSKLWLPSEKLAESEEQYVAFGEKNGVDMAYKCRIRNPWYRVPGVRVPDVILTGMSDCPRLYWNDAKWTVSNSVLSGHLREGESPENFLRSWYTPLTLLSAEMQIHSLGGGVMIAVPSEADNLRILQSKYSAPGELSRVDAALRAKEPDAAYRVGSEAIKKLGGREAVNAIDEGIEVLRLWRKGGA